MRIDDEGRRVVVTGASGAIGRATCASLQARGMVVAGLDLRPTDGFTLFEPCDVTLTSSVNAAIAKVADTMGGLDALVNVAGGSARAVGDGPVDECTDDGWDHALALNLSSAMRTSRASLPRLGTGSAIVNVASVLGLVGDASGSFQAHGYASAKGGLIALTRAMAAAYAIRGVRVNAVAPGLVDTPMSERARQSEPALSAAAARQRLSGPLLQPEDVAAAIAFLVSTESRNVTGIVLPVDGGWLAT